jgi:hypothetical protein
MPPQSAPPTPPCERETIRSKQQIEQIVVWERLCRYNRGLPCGPKTLRSALAAQLPPGQFPSERTIARILARNGLTHGRTGFYPGDAP